MGNIGATGKTGSELELSEVVYVTFKNAFGEKNISMGQFSTNFEASVQFPDGKVAVAQKGADSYQISVNYLVDPIVPLKVSMCVRGVSSDGNKILAEAQSLASLESTLTQIANASKELLEAHAKYTRETRNIINKYK